jgi:type I restriction enzyme S subunit
MEALTEEVVFEKYPIYKDSGVEWLGEVPEHWMVSKVKFQISSQKGKNPKSISVEPTENIYLSMDYLRGRGQAIQYVNSKKDLIEVLDGDLLLLWDGANAGEFITGKQGILSSTMALITINVVNKDYCKYFFKAIEMQLRAYTVGMGIPHVNGNQFSNLLFLLPKPVEQIAIAKFLDSKSAQINQAIAQKEKQIELLKERRQVLIHKAVTRGLNPGVPLQDSCVVWIGEIPEHWSIANNSSLFSERKESGDSSLPLLSVSIHTAVSSEELSDEDNIRGKIRIEDKTSYKLVEVNDIAFNMMRAWQGAIGAVSTKGMVSPAYIVAKPKTEINSEFFEYQYRTRTFIQQMDRFSKGITDFRKRLYWPEFKQLKTIVPPLREQIQIVEFIKVNSEKTDAAIAFKEKEIEKLKEYKTTLINNAVTGKIKVRQPK